MKLCNLERDDLKVQGSIVIKGSLKMKSELWEVIYHPVTYVQPKEVILKQCQLRVCLMANGKCAYALGLPIFGTFHFSRWYKQN